MAAAVTVKMLVTALTFFVKLENPYKKAHPNLRSPIAKSAVPNNIKVKPNVPKIAMKILKANKSNITEINTTNPNRIAIALKTHEFFTFVFSSFNSKPSWLETITLIFLNKTSRYRTPAIFKNHQFLGR